MILQQPTLLFEGTQTNTSPPNMVAPSQLPTDQDASATISSLDTAVAELLELSIQNAPLSAFYSFFTKWEDSSNSAQSQPTALKSFNESFALRLMIEKDRNDTVQCMLSYGFQIPDSAMAMALRRANVTGSLTILGHLFEGGWDINRPVNECTPPAIRCVTRLLAACQTYDSRSNYL
jgi:hypothetical protein